ncbi:hypothetical protein PG996_016008 [Apiospora saccharicola]|uniref:Uncharacterized protein n=1 Tax=Apiospora saccharicola TaxID=335842 RepID=A0ABR1TQE4_9PEZI
MSIGYVHSETQHESFASTTNLAPTPGHHGYITFRPKYLCAKGHTEGDFSGEKLEPMKGRKWCIPKTLSGGGLDGDWEVVETD